MALKDLFRIASSKSNDQTRMAKLYRDLLRHEAKIGGELFGPVAPGGRREFFCLDEHTWIWHEEWKDESGNIQTRTTRYDVRPNGIVKAQDGKHYQSVTREEATRLHKAAKLYHRRIRAELYKAVV